MLNYVDTLDWNIKSLSRSRKLGMTGEVGTLCSFIWLNGTLALSLIGSDSVGLDWSLCFREATATVFINSQLHWEDGSCPVKFEPLLASFAFDFGVCNQDK